MRKVSRRALALGVIFVIGGVTGYVAGWVSEVVGKRSGYLGGEVLIIPAFVLLFILGWRTSKEHHRSLYNRAWQEETRKQRMTWRR